MPSGRLIDYLGTGPIADRPAAPDLHPGTLGLWYADDTDTLSAWDGSVWADISGGGGSGDVVGPASSTNNSVALFDGTTGKLLKDGGPLPAGLSDGDKGDITVSSGGTVWAIDAQAVSNAKMADVPTGTFKGRATAGSGSPEDLTTAQATALLDAFTSSLKGLVPASGGGTTNFLRADGTWAAAGGGGGGLTGFTGTLETASPNNSVNASVLAASGGTTDQDAIFSAKGIGAIAAQLADGASTGGNKRGAWATDLQKLRSNQVHVASASASGILAGRNNRATAVNATVVAGSGNGAIAQNAAVVGGDSNFSEGSESFIGGGGSNQNTSSANQGVVAGGFQNLVSAGYGAIPGGIGNVVDASYGHAMGAHATTRGMIGSEAHSSHAAGAKGAHQRMGMVLRAATNGATPVRMTSDGNAASSNNQFRAVEAGACIVRLDVVAYHHSGPAAKSWEVRATVRNTGGVTTVVGTPTVTPLDADASAAAWTITVAADTGNNCLAITATGESGKNIVWTARGLSTEVQTP